MSKTGIAVAFILFLIIAAGARAENICDQSKLPYYPSFNSSMLLVIPTSEVDAKLSDLSGPVSIGWEGRDTALNTIRWGSMQKFGDCWICEFSGADSNFDGNCGITPFTESGQYSMYFYAEDFSHHYADQSSIDFNRTMAIHSQRMTAGVNIGDDGVVYITADTPTATEEAWITIFNADDGEMLNNFDKVNLTKTTYPGRYTYEITGLPSGKYYAAFGFRTSGGEGGGDLAKFEIESQALSLQSDKKSYYIGEDVTISGQTKYSKVSASIKTPGGKVESLGTVDAVNQQYSFTFHIPAEYETGDYEITATAGGNTAKHIFSVKQLLSISPLSLVFDIYDTETAVSKNISIQNLGNDSLSLSSATESMGNHVYAQYNKSLLGGLESTTLSVTVNPSSLTESVTGKLLVKAGDSISIPVGIMINLIQQTGNGNENSGIGSLKVTPVIWQEDNCIPDSSVSKTFSVQAVDSVASDFSYDASSGIDVTKIDLPDSVDKNSYGSIDIEVTPSGINEDGQIEIKSNIGTSTIYVSMKCVDDITESLTTLEDSISTLKLSYSDIFEPDTVTSLFSFIDSDVEAATSSLESGDYASAQQSYLSASSRYDSLDSVITELQNGNPLPGEESPIMTWVIIIIVLAVLGVAGFLVYTKYGSRIIKKGESSNDEDVDEELY